ncbi:MAG: chemotaxis protein CheD [Promethearchaeota archaeon]
MCEKEQIDRVEKIGRHGEINLPIGHYALVNDKYISSKAHIKITIYGLGSCIALILFDEKCKVCGMSHILLPKANPNKSLRYPHKYADLSVKLLINELISHGAKKENIQAIVVGGSKIFNLDENSIGINNIEVVKKELEKFKIKIVNKDIGGSYGRTVIFNTYNYSVLVKLSIENEFRKL